MQKSITNKIVNVKTLNRQNLQKSMIDQFRNQKLDNALILVKQIKLRNYNLQSKYIVLIEQIEQQVQKLQSCLKYFYQPTQNWRKQKFNQNAILSSKVLNKSQIMIKFDGQLEIDIFNLASMVYQTQLYKNWVPFCSESKDIKTLSLAQKVAFLQFNLPFISNREGYFYGKGIDRISYNNTVIIYCQGITGSKKHQQRFNMNLEKKSKSVEFDLKFFICEIKLIRKGVVNLRAFSHIDIHMFFIPEFLLAFFSEKIGQFLFGKLIKSANDIKGTQWQNKINQDKDEFYKWLKQRVNQLQSKLKI